MARLIVFKGCVRRRRCMAPGRLSANGPTISKVYSIRGSIVEI